MKEVQTRVYTKTMQSPIQGKHSTHLSHNCYKCNKTCNVKHFSRFTFEIKGRTIYLPRQPTAGSSFKVHFICAWIFTALSPHLHTGHLQLPPNEPGDLQSEARTASIIHLQQIPVQSDVPLLIWLAYSIYCHAAECFSTISFRLDQ